MANLETALSVFQADTDRLPSTEEGLAALLTAPPGVINWHGPYLRAPAIDPWNNPYVYRLTAPTMYDLRSAGADGKPGTGDDVVERANP